MTDNLLWLDLETSGSDETKDCVLEIGCVLTTPDLAVLGEWSTLVRPTEEGYGRLLLNPTVRALHKKSGLLADMAEMASRDASQDTEASWPKPHQAAKGLLHWLDRHTTEQVVLAGSGVAHFDRRFIRRWLPEVDRRLRHWVIDVGVVRRCHAMWVGTEVSAANEGKTHRALDDVRCHVAEAIAFKDLWEKQANG